MGDYISRDVTIIEFMDNDIDHIQAPGGKEAVQILSDIPAANVVQVVRCKDCKHHAYDEIFSCYWCEYPGRVRDTTPDGFCEKGEE